MRIRSTGWAKRDVDKERDAAKKLSPQSWSRTWRTVLPNDSFGATAMFATDPLRRPVVRLQSARTGRSLCRQSRRSPTFLKDCHEAYKRLCSTAAELEAFRVLPWPMLAMHVRAGSTLKTVDVEGEELQLEVRVSMTESASKQGR
jgi:hypothetical protein